MIRKGITTFVDFREGGLDGVALLKKVLSDVPLRSIILGRVEFYQGSTEIRKNLPFPREKIKDLAGLLKKWGFSDKALIVSDFPVIFFDVETLCFVSEECITLSFVVFE